MWTALLIAWPLVSVGGALLLGRTVDATTRAERRHRYRDGQ